VHVASSSTEGHVMSDRGEPGVRRVPESGSVGAAWLGLGVGVDRKVAAAPAEIAEARAPIAATKDAVGNP
jgi:hypothetical protein